MLRTILTFLAVALGVIAAGLVAGYFVLQPNIWHVAIPQSDTASRQVFEAAAEQFRLQKKPIRLVVDVTPDTTTALSKLERGEAQLTVARAQDAIKARAQSVLVLRQETAILMTPKKSKVRKLPDILGAEIAVLREGTGDPGTLSAVLDFYKLDRAKLKVQFVTLDELPNVIRRIDVLAVVGTPGSKLLADAVAVARATRGELRFIAVDQAEAIAKRVPELDSVDIAKGVFGGRPPYPDDEFTTIGFSVRALATEAISRDTISDFLHQILTARQAIAQSVPSARSLKLAEADDDNFVVHEGVRTYGDGEVKNFFERYSDQIYVGTLVASGVGSASAALFGWFTTRRRGKVMSSIFSIEQVIDSVPGTKSVAELDALEQQADEIFRVALKTAAKGEIDAAGIAAFEMALIDARARIRQRRTDLMATANGNGATAATPSEPTAQLIQFTPASGTPANPSAS